MVFIYDFFCSNCERREREGEREKGEGEGEGERF